MSTLIKDKTNSILIEVTTNSGIHNAGTNTGKILDASTKIVESAMDIIKTMSNSVSSTIVHLAADSRPSNVEASFGISINGEGNTFVAKTGVEATINVKLTWESCE